MRTFPLFVGDEQGLRDGPQRRYREVGTSAGYYAGPDPEFQDELFARRTALKISGVKFAQEAGCSQSFLSMVQRGKAYASEDMKARIRATFDRLEGENAV